MSITMQSTNAEKTTLAEAIAAIPDSGSETIIIKNETISESVNGVDEKIIWDVEDTIFSDNSPGKNYGGAVDITNNMTGNSFKQTTFSNNKATSGSGAIFVRSGAEVTMTDVTFTNNSAANGGAIYNSQANAVIKIYGAEFRDNKATDGNGGAIRNDKVMYLGNAEFHTNSCTKNGSAIFNGGTIYVTGKITLGTDQTIYNNGTIQILGNSFLTTTNSLAKAIDANSSSWLGNKAITVSSGYKIFTAADNDLYVTNAGTVDSTAAMVGDYAAVIGKTAYYGTHYDTISDAAGSNVVVSGHTSSAAETLGSGKTLLITGSTVGKITFSGSNSVVLGDKKVDFTDQDLSGVTLAVNGNFASGEYTLATGITKLPETITVNNSVVAVNGAGFVSADGKSVSGISLNEGVLKLRSSDTITIVQLSDADGFDTFDSLANAQQAYSTFSGNIKYDVTGYCNQWKSTDAVPETITVDGKEYSMKFGENAFSSISTGKNTLSANGVFIHYNTNIYEYSIADARMIVHGGKFIKGRASMTAGTSAKYVDVTFDSVDASEIGNVVIGAKTDVTAGNWNVKLNDIHSSQSAFLADGSVGGNINAGVKESSFALLCVMKDGSAAGDMTLSVTNSEISGDVKSYNGEKENLCKNITFTLTDTTVGGRIITSGTRKSLIDGDVNISLTDSYIGNHILLAYGHATLGGNTITGDAAVTLSGSTTGGVVRSMNNGVVNGTVSLTAAAGRSDAGTLTGVDTITVKSGASLAVAAWEVFSADQSIVLENGCAGFTLAGMDFASGASMTFTGQLFDISSTAITVDASAITSDTVIANGVKGSLDGNDAVLNNTGFYLSIEDDKLYLKQNVDAAISKHTDNAFYGSTVENNGTGLSVEINSDFNGTVRAGSVSGWDSTIATAMTGGNIAKNLYGGGLVSAGTTALSISGGKVSLDVYGGIYSKDADTTLANSNVDISGGEFGCYVIGGSRVQNGKTHHTGNVSLTITGGNFAGYTDFNQGHKLWAAGYLIGTGTTAAISTEGEPDYALLKEAASLVVDNASLHLAMGNDGGISGLVYAGAYASKSGIAFTVTGEVVIDSGTYGCVAGGGLGSTGGISVTENTVITMNDGRAEALIGGGANTDGSRTFTKSAKLFVNGGNVDTVFMGSRCTRSTVYSSRLEVTGGSIGTVTGCDLAGNDNVTGWAAIDVKGSAAIGSINGVDALHIYENFKLTLDETIDFAAREDGFLLNFKAAENAEWTALSSAGFANWESARLSVNNNDVSILSWSDNSALLSDGSTLTVGEDNTLTFKKGTIA